MFIDSNIFISAALGNDGRAKSCREFLARVESGEQRAITSVLVLDEILRRIDKYTKNRESAAAKTARFATLPNLRVCDVTGEHFSESLKYFKAGLEPRDALHMAVALANGADKILSYDRDFDRIKGITRAEP
jgi:predicted nucleic acid-binding protein